MEEAPSAAPAPAVTPATAPDAAPQVQQNNGSEFDFTPQDVSALVAHCPYEKLRGLYEAGQLIRDAVNQRWSKGA
jgi:hypothetical protein